MMELSGTQQKQILDFCKDCIAPDGDMTDFVAAACRSQLKGYVIHQLNGYKKGKKNDWKAKSDSGPSPGDKKDTPTPKPDNKAGKQIIQSATKSFGIFVQN